MSTHGHAGHVALGIFDDQCAKCHPPIPTPLGANVRVYDPPENLGAGAMLLLTMQDPADPRTAEVYLDPDAVAAVREALTPYAEGDQQPAPPATAVAVCVAAAEQLDTAMGGYATDDWTDAVRLLRDLRVGIETMRRVDADLVRWIYLHGEHGAHQHIEGVAGEVAVTRTRSKERWETEAAVKAYVDARMVEREGEMPDPLEVVAWVLDVLPSGASVSCKKTALRNAGLDLEDYYHSEPGTLQVQLQVPRPASSPRQDQG